jgi:hypothetical protein
MIDDLKKNDESSPLETRRSLEPTQLITRPEEEPAPEPDIERLERFTNKKSWWRRFLAGEPPDPRSSPREPIPGLVAYFFTGGAPTPHLVRDISKDGIYVITKERWYPDTLLRITLSDERDPSADLSLTLHARVARAGSDGVGFEFVLFEKQDLDESITSQVEDQTLLVGRAQFEKFLKRFKSATKDRE